MTKPSDPASAPREGCINDGRCPHGGVVCGGLRLEANAGAICRHTRAACESYAPGYPASPPVGAPPDTASFDAWIKTPEADTVFLGRCKTCRQSLPGFSSQPVGAPAVPVAEILRLAEEFSREADYLCGQGDLAAGNAYDRCAARVRALSRSRGAK